MEGLHNPVIPFEVNIPVLQSTIQIQLQTYQPDTLSVTPPNQLLYEQTKEELTKQQWFQNPVSSVCL